jgi:hypothetical protein
MTEGHGLMLDLFPSDILVLISGKLLLSEALALRCVCKRMSERLSTQKLLFARPGIHSFSRSSFRWFANSSYGRWCKITHIGLNFEARCGIVSFLTEDGCGQCKLTLVCLSAVFRAEKQKKTMNRQLDRRKRIFWRPRC